MRMLPATELEATLLFILIFAPNIGTALTPTRASDPNRELNTFSVYLTSASNPVKGACGVGDGELYVFTNPLRTYEAARDSSDKYLVLFNKLYYFTIDSITEYSVGQTIKIWACYRCQTDLIGIFSVEQGEVVEFAWTIPNLPDKSEIKYKYGLSLTGPNPSWRFAKRITHGVGMTMVIPDVPFMTLGSISVFFAAFGTRTYVDRRRKRR